MRRAATLLVVPAVLLAPATPAGSTDAKPRAAVKGHDVELTWTPDDQDIAPGSKTVLDTFDSSGPPFDDDAWAPAFAETLTPRKQIGEDRRTGRWRIDFGKQGKRGVCFGTFRITREVIETSESEQVVQYRGTMTIDGCRKSRRFAKLRPDTLRVRGETTCVPGSCSGYLAIEGFIYY